MAGLLGSWPRPLDMKRDRYGEIIDEHTRLVVQARDREDLEEMARLYELALAWSERHFPKQNPG